MAVESTNTQMMGLEDLAAGINEGSVVLPDFQRDFDWSEKDVREVLVTVLNGWPAGSLLIMRGVPRFRIRAFESAPTGAAPPKFVVLDGQQRLTALYQALYGLGKHLYAVDYSALLEGRELDLDIAVVSIERRAWDAQPRTVAQRHLVPLSSLRSPSEFFSWRDTVIQSIAETERPPIRDVLTRWYRDTLTEIHRYRFPVVVLERAFEPAAIAQIFDRVNRMGIQRLGAFDLMVAQLYEPEWNLRDKWEQARSGSALIDRFLADDGLPVLLTLALHYPERLW